MDLIMEGKGLWTGKLPLHVVGGINIAIVGFFQSSGIDTGMKSEHELVPPYSLEGLLFRYQ